MNFLFKIIFPVAVLCIVAFGSYKLGQQNQIIAMEKPAKERVIEYIHQQRASQKEVDLTKKFGNNFSKMNFDGVDLSNVILKNADLSYANLKNANIQGSNLSGSNLKYANLSRVKLQGSVLDNTDFSYANLSKSELNGVSIKKANFSYANLKNANLCMRKPNNFVEKSFCKIY